MGDDSVSNKFIAIARRSYLDLGMPRVGREVIGHYPTRGAAEDACTEYVKSQGERFRADYDDCVVEALCNEDTPKVDP